MLNSRTSRINLKVSIPSQIHVTIAGLYKALKSHQSSEMGNSGKLFHKWAL